MTPSSATVLEAAGVSVRQLEWVQDANGQWIADTPIGRYIIQCPYRGSEHSVWLNGPNMVALQFPNAALNDVGWAHIEAPQAAAQADYVARIMSALTVTSFPPAEQHDVTSHAVPPDGEGAVAWPGREFCEIAERNAVKLAGKLSGGEDTKAALDAALAIRTLLATHPAPVAAQPAEGWVTVPREPTETMLSAFHTGFLQQLGVRKRNRFKPLEKLTPRERESAEQAGMRAMLASSPTPPTAPAVPAGVREALIEKFCGDKVNGGMLRDMAYTVWHACHHPAHEDGNTDWGNDTLPIVNKAVEALREALSALPAQPNSSEGEPTWWDVEEFKVWMGIDASKPQWHGLGFACSSWTAANELAEYLLHNDASLVLRVAPVTLATNPEPKL